METIIKEKLNSLVKYANDNYSNNFELWVQSCMDYYNGIPTMTDDEFDNLTEELLEEFLEDTSEYGNLIVKILNKGIATFDNTFKIEHTTNNTEQLSLFKIKFDNFNQTKNEIRKFLNINGSEKLYLAPKFDGISIKIIYNSDFSINRIQTRGGQDYTSLLSNNKSIQELTHKLKVMNSSDKIIHGELVVSKQLFNQKYSDKYKNPRNAINGIVKEEPNDLDFIACTTGFNILQLDSNSVWKPFDINTHLENLYFSEFKNDNFKYQTDGIVISKVIQNNEFQIKDNYPLNFVAIKFKSVTSKPTKVIDIEWTMKKSGKLTPVLVIEPTDLDGITISNANCYSFNKLKQLHCGIGSIISVRKSGDIIPTIDKVFQRSDNFKIPENSTLNGKHLFIINKNENDDIQKQKFILGLKLLNIEGIGPVISEEIGSIVNYDIIELFNQIHYTDIAIKLGMSANLERFKKFYDIKTIPLNLLIEILQFDGIGKSLSMKFAEIMIGKNINTKGINHTLLKETCSNGGKNKIILTKSIDRLKSFGIKVIKPIEISDDNFTFEMSGNPPGITKQEFVNKLKEKYPNAIHTTLTKNTTYLFTDNLSSSSSKSNKARKYNVKIMTYQQAFEYDFSKDVKTE